MFVKILLLAVFFVVTTCVGLYFRRVSRSVDGFVLGGRSLGPWLTAFSYGASYFSAVVFVGYAGQFGWRFGVSALWIGLGNAFIGSLCAWVVLARRTRVMTQHLGSATMPSFFGSRYGSDSLKICAALITFVFLVPYTASLYNGLSRLFEMAFGVDFVVCIIVMAALTAVYVIAGGYTASVVNDFIQGIIMLVGIVAVIVAVLNIHGGFGGSMEALANVRDLSVSTAPGIFTSMFGPNLSDLIGVLLLTSVGTWGLPQMVSRFYSIRSEKNITTGTVVSTVFAVVVAGGCYFLGSFGRLFDRPEIHGESGVIFDAIVPAMISGMPDIIIGIVLLLVFASSMSTLSSLVVVSASTLTLDFIKDVIVKKMGEKIQLIVIRSLIAVFIAVSAVIAVFQYRSGTVFIAQLMGISWGALAGAFLAPFLYGLYWKRATKQAVWVNFLFASLFMVANIFFRPYFPALLQSPINAGAFTMLIGLAIVPAVSALTPHPNRKLVENAFSCYEATVEVPAKQALGGSGGGKKNGKKKR